MVPFGLAQGRLLTPLCVAALEVVPLGMTMSWRFNESYGRTSKARRGNRKLPRVSSMTFTWQV
jgi:hypothetical protein